MKTIYRQLFFGMLLTAMTAVGTSTALAQTATPDPCEGAAASYTEFTAAWKKYDDYRTANKKGDIDLTKAAIDKAKEFLGKYGSCTEQDAGIKFAKDDIPNMEQVLERAKARVIKTALIEKWNKGLAAKNWDDVYSSGKELLAKYPDDWRDAKLVLGSIGLDETGKQTPVNKWNDETLKYAKESIADIEAGKKFTFWGAGPFIYKGKDDALGWMNYTIGFIQMIDKKNKKEGAASMYKVTQINADAKSTPYAYVAIGLSYIDDLNTNIEQSKALPGLVTGEAPEVSQQKADAIKAKAAMIKGIAERIMDAYARAYKLADPKPAGKAYKDSLKAKFKEIYDIRFRTPDATTPTVDAWIDAAFAKPLPNPATAITPVVEVEKTTSVTPGSSTVKPTGTTPTTTVKPGTAPAAKPGTPAVKPAGPGAKPTAPGIKPGVAKVKKKGTR